MIKNFQPVMAQTLIYIDDILLYSPDQESHATLLEKFKQVVLQYGIMLSERKMQVNREEIEFLGMIIKEGRYQPHPSIAKELKKFPARNLSQKQVQKDAKKESSFLESQTDLSSQKTQREASSSTTFTNSFRRKKNLTDRC
ncbi:hypothetical protein Gotur_035562 [Gossypium turneri]